ncbi:Endonuclease/exonuclease/phosphatase [Trema orientale]|uniref:Endonuclease/exonuclease/phosphatase n=1 Tax=Trema orientale TaxID=63057 RepID=A0A2P5F9Y2_TREOI|nr:Endonuclease/exonuclease/phosphatase [Trema orientale]
MINCLVFSDPPTQPWLLSAIYGPPNAKERVLFWKKFALTRENFNGTWLVIGDLNGTLEDGESSSRAQRDRNSSEFHRAVRSTGLIDLGAQGNYFTWSNKRRGRANTRVRLDRAMSDTQ